MSKYTVILNKDIILADIGLRLIYSHLTGSMKLFMFHMGNVQFYITKH
jgi:hypothetical protein